MGNISKTASNAAQPAKKPMTTGTRKAAVHSMSAEACANPKLAPDA
jgi:hypothetical protein